MVMNEQFHVHKSINSKKILIQMTLNKNSNTLSASP